MNLEPKTDVSKNHVLVVVILVLCIAAVAFFLLARREKKDNPKPAQTTIDDKIDILKRLSREEEKASSIIKLDTLEKLQKNKPTTAEPTFEEKLKLLQNL